MGNKMADRRASRAAVEVVIADAIASFMPEADEGQDATVSLAYADAVIEALRDSGYRVTLTVSERTR